MTRERWIEVGRILLAGLVSLLYWRALVPLPVLLVAVTIGLYSRAKTGILDLVRVRKIGTDVLVFLNSVKLLRVRIETV